MITISHPTPSEVEARWARRVRAERSASAIVGMAERYAEANREFAYALAGDNGAERDRAERACVRRFAALQRLAYALADVGVER